MQLWRGEELCEIPSHVGRRREQNGREKVVVKNHPESVQTSAGVTQP